MDIKQALRIIQDRADVYGMSLLDTAIVMEELAGTSMLEPKETEAIRLFLREGRAVLRVAPLEAGQALGWGRARRLPSPTWVPFRPVPVATPMASWSLAAL